MSNRVYSFLDVVAAIVGPGGAISIGSGAGVGEEEALVFTPTGPRNQMQIGADGEGQHSLNNDRSGTLTLTLLKTSPTNAALMAMFNFQTNSAGTHGQNTITITDKNRNDVGTLRQVAFRQVPDMRFAKQAGTFDWVFDVIRADWAIGA